MKIKCWECDKKLEFDVKQEWVEEKSKYWDVHCSKIYNPPESVWKRVYCEDCEPIVVKEKKEEKQRYIQLKTKMMFERAISSLEKQNLDFYKYREAIKSVYEFALEKPNKFDSSYEMIAAIVLINDRISCKLQYPIERYKADFYLPDLKCILEIDGERHSHRLLEDSNRDIKIRNILGYEWEVVRIPTEYLEQNAKMLLKAINEMKKLKQDTRKKHGGMLPSNFSKRDKAKSKEIERIVNNS